MMVLHQDHERDSINNVTSGLAIVQDVPVTSILLSSHEADFHVSGCINNKILVTGQKITQKSYTTTHYTLSVLRFGAHRWIWSNWVMLFWEMWAKSYGNSNLYVDVLRNFLPSDISRQPMNVLRDMFPERVISHREQHPMACLVTRSRCMWFIDKSQ